LWKKSNDFFELVREIFQDNVAEVKLIDKFYNNKKNKYSNTYKIIFIPNDEYFDCSNPAKFNEFCNEQMKKLNDIVCEKLNVELR
jgi:phenylalanyl-tRNA synthetase beta subunit